MGGFLSAIRAPTHVVRISWRELPVSCICALTRHARQHRGAFRSRKSPYAFGFDILLNPKNLNIELHPYRVHHSRLPPQPFAKPAFGSTAASRLFCSCFLDSLFPGIPCPSDDVREQAPFIVFRTRPSRERLSFLDKSSVY